MIEAMAYATKMFMGFAKQLKPPAAEDVVSILIASGMPEYYSLREIARSAQDAQRQARDDERELHKLETDELKDEILRLRNGPPRPTIVPAESWVESMQKAGDQLMNLLNGVSLAKWDPKDAQLFVEAVDAARVAWKKAKDGES